MEAEAFLTFALLFPQHLGWQGSPMTPTPVSTHLCKWFPKLDTLKPRPPPYSLLTGVGNSRPKLLKEGRVCLGSRFEGVVHQDGGSMMAGQ